MKIRLLISYKGTYFLGWQKQKEGPTIQGELEKALSKLYQMPIPVVGSGRTDAGVHALGQVAHFETLTALPTKSIVKALNHLSPNDISIKAAWKAPKEFHARFSAQKKTYQFFICNSDTPPAITKDLVWWLPQDLDLKRLNRMGQMLLGHHDLSSFETSGSDIKNKKRTIFQVKWESIDPHLHRFSITGSGFLKQGVRNIVGTQVDLMRKKESEACFKKILSSCSREEALGTAPSSGLYLIKVYYPEILDRKCRKL